MLHTLEIVGIRRDFGGHFVAAVNRRVVGSNPTRGAAGLPGTAERRGPAVPGRRGVRQPVRGPQAGPAGSHVGEEPALVPNFHLGKHCDGLTRYSYLWGRLPAELGRSDGRRQREPVLPADQLPVV